MENTVYIGIDIACKKFDACLYQATRRMPHAVFDNNPDGFAEFLRWCKQHKAKPARIHAVMEATNTYWEALAEYLQEQLVKVSVVNPRCIKDYGKSQNLRSKTDKIDAAIIARYAHKEQPESWQAPRAPLRQLLLLLRQLEHLKTAEQKERTRMTMQRDPLARESSARVSAFLQTEIRAIEDSIKALIEGDEEIRHNAELLTTIPAIGEKSIPWLLAYLHDGKRFKNGKAAATYAGLTPMLEESGDSVNGRPRISKIGHSEIRRVLYMPALVYSYGRYKSGVYRDFVERLERNGKAKKAIIVALMRKLITIAQAVLQHQKPFDPALMQKSFHNA